MSMILLLDGINCSLRMLDYKRSSKLKLDDNEGGKKRKLHGSIYSCIGCIVTIIILLLVSFVVYSYCS